MTRSKCFHKLVLLLCCVQIKGENLEDVQRVLDTVFTPTKYNKMIRGVLDQRNAVEVNISFNVLSIVNVNEIEETLAVMGVLYIRWVDERLVWNSTDYNDTTAVHVFQNQVWKPEVVLANPAHGVTLIGNYRIMTTHLWNGIAQWNVGDLFKFSCSFDVTAYPWDSQKCSVQFMVWGYHSSEVKLVTPSDTTELRYFTENGAWELVSAGVSSEDSTISMVTFTFELRRYSKFSVVNVFIPILTLTFLNILAYCIPPESGEKLSYCITVLLALSVFLSIVAGHLPGNSNNMAWLCYYLMIILMMSTLICASAVVSVGLHHKTDKGSPPPWLCSIVAKIYRKKPSQRDSDDVISLKERSNMAFEDFKHHNRRPSIDSSDSDQNNITWQDVGRFVNAISFAITIIWLLVSTVLFVAFILSR